ncbi:MAG: sigma 54-interacting transcriptional regulator [Myxococcota bacterium]|nr:sigma 54-interacting transcriptional regulator [Myxococcota bacterium]
MEAPSLSSKNFVGEYIHVLTIAYHPDFRRIGEETKFVQIGDLKEPTQISRITPNFSRPETRGQNPLLDGFVSRRPISLVQRPDETLQIYADEGGHKHSVNNQPLTSPKLFTVEEQNRGIVILIARRIVLVLRRRPLVLRRNPGFGLVGSSNEIDSVRTNILRVADTSTSVLIRGATGTGKELVAQAIHDHSLRAKQPFVAVNMAAIPTTTAISQLFGHAKGAFSGAERDHKGYFGQAQNGTLFLDEVGETSVETQAALLRVLETKSVQSVGAEKNFSVDVRVISATDADLDQAVENGSLREPLLHRLRAFEIEMPLLKDRPEDVGTLFVYFMRRELESLGEWEKWQQRSDYSEHWIEPQFICQLIGYEFRGNVRELRNMVRRIVISSRGERKLVTQDIQTVIAAQNISRSSLETLNLRVGSEEERASPPPSQIETPVLLETLAACEWKAKDAAQALGISRSSLYNLIEQTPEIPKAKNLSLEQITEAKETFENDLEKMAHHFRVSRRALQLRIKELG